MLKRQRLPGWLDELMKEMMKPPYFLDASKRPNQFVPPTPTTSSEQAGSVHVEHEAPPSETRRTSTRTYMAQSRDERYKYPRDDVQENRPTSPTNHGGITTASTRVEARKVVEAKKTREVNKTGDTSAEDEWVDNGTVPRTVISQYGWKVNRVEPVQNVAHVYTTSGSFAVKQTHVSLQHVRFMKDLLDYAKQNGFSRYASFVLTKKQRPATKLNGKTFYATKWVEGTPVNFATTAHVGQTAYTLAEFHESTRGFHTKDGYTPESAFHLFTMAQQRNRDLRQLLRMAEAKANRDEFDELFISLKTQLQEDAQESLQLLQQADCEAFLQNEEKRPGICHLDVIPANFVFDGDHKVHMLDFDLSTFAPRVLDIAHLLRRSMQQTNWTPEIAYTCFLHYNAVKAMPKVEYSLVQSILAFPYRAWRLAHTRYRFFADPAQIEELKAYRAQDERRHTFLTEFSKQVNELSVSG